MGSQVTFTAEFVALTVDGGSFDAQQFVAKDPQKGKPIAKNIMGAIPQPPH